MRVAPAVAATLVLAACAVADTGDGASCGADEYRSLLGSNIAAVTLPAEPNIRTIGPDEAVTMEFLPSRLNIAYDESGTITRVYCG